MIGSLGVVSDQYCIEVAKIFYEILNSEGMTDRAVYRELHKAVRALRNKEIGLAQWNRSRRTISMNLGSSGSIRDANLEDDEDDPVNHIASDSTLLSWASYVHFGV